MTILYTLWFSTLLPALINMMFVLRPTIETRERVQEAVTRAAERCAPPPPPCPTQQGRHSAITIKYIVKLSQPAMSTFYMQQVLYYMPR